MNNTNVLEASSVARTTKRIEALDVARGFAILGTLWTNIWLFTHTHGLAGYLLNPDTEGTSAASATVSHALQALSQGKFLALLTLLFGMGLAIQHAAALRKGQRWPGRYLRRAGLLFADGLLNYFLIAEFDVLMGYAVTAAIVAYLLLSSRRTQRRLMLGFAATHVTLISLIAWGASTLDTTPRPWVGPNPYAEGSFLDLVGFRLDNLIAFRAEPVLICFGTIAMFLLGAQLLRAGIFTAEGAGLRRRLLLVGAIAWPIDLLLGVFGGLSGVLLERYLVAPLVALGLLALISEACLRSRRNGWFSRRLTEVGRMALSCYLAQNLIAGALFYGWGLGLAAQLGEYRLPATILGYLSVAAAVIAFAHFWLRRFPLGPLEWLWKKI